MFYVIIGLITIGGTMILRAILYGVGLLGHNDVNDSVETESHSLQTNDHHIMAE